MQMRIYILHFIDCTLFL